MINRISALLICFLVISSCSGKRSKLDNCKNFDRVFNSINSQTTKIDIPVDALECKFKLKLDTTHFKSALLLEYFKLADMRSFFYKVNCIAGSDCSHYYLSVLDADLNLINTKLVAKDSSEGEYNEYVSKYDFSHKEELILTFNKEHFSEEKEDYISESYTTKYRITKQGNILELKE